MRCFSRSATFHEKLVSPAIQRLTYENTWGFLRHATFFFCLLEPLSFCTVLQSCVALFFFFSTLRRLAPPSDTQHYYYYYYYY